MMGGVCATVCVYRVITETQRQAAFELCAVDIFQHPAGAKHAGEPVRDVKRRLGFHVAAHPENRVQVARALVDEPKFTLVVCLVIPVSSNQTLRL